MLLFISLSLLIQIALIIVVVGLVGFFLWKYLSLELWFNAVSSGVSVSFFRLILLRFQGIPPEIMISNQIRATKGGLKLDMEQMENLYQAKGNLDNVIRALISAKNAGIPLDWGTATGVDLAGRDIHKAVREAISTKIIESQKVIHAIPQDGVELKFKASITVRTNVKTLLGGAGEETLVPRVEQKLVSRISSSKEYKYVLSNPTKIADVLEPYDVRNVLEDAYQKISYRVKVTFRDTRDIRRRMEESRKELEDISKDLEFVYVELENALEELRNMKLRADTEYEKLDRERHKLSELRKLTVEINRNYESRMEVFEQERDEIMLRTVPDVEQAVKALKEARINFEMVTQRLEELSKEVEDIGRAKQHHQRQIHDLDAEAADLGKREAEIKQREEEYRLSIEQRKKDLERIRGEIQQAKTEGNEARERDLRTEILILEEGLDDKEAQLEQYHKQFLDCEQKLREILEKIHRNSDSLNQTTQKLEDAKSDWESELNKLTTTCDRIDSIRNLLVRKKLEEARREQARNELEENTIYHVVSVEIIDLEVGSDVGAKLELEQLKADGERKQQEALRKRLELELREKEAHIHGLEMKHRLIESESKVKEALAEAFRNNNIGALDYYKLQNLMADTRMRDNMSSEDLK